MAIMMSLGLLFCILLGFRDGFRIQKIGFETRSRVSGLAAFQKSLQYSYSCFIGNEGKMPA